MAVDTREALRKLQSGQALTAAEKVALNIAPSNLDAAAQANQANADTTIAALKDLGVGGAPTVDTRAALAKLTSGQTLTDDEKRALGMQVTSASTPNVSGDSNTPAIPNLNNRNVTPTDDPGQGYKWQWVSMSKTNNQYGGEWRKVPVSSSTSGTTGATGGATTDSTAALLKQQAADKAAADAAAAKAERVSAYNILLNEFNKYGLGSLVSDVKDMLMNNYSPAEFSIALQNTDAYKQRFAANQDRIKAGLRALTPAEYVGLEDQYQNIMRNYGLPSSYYAKDTLGTQAGLNKLIANDVSAAELEDRIATAQKRVLNADPNVMDALRQFYPDITKNDLLAYTLDPTNALENIKRKVTAAEIGGAALGQGLGTSASRAEELAKYGITKAQAQQGYQTIGEFLPTGQKLSDIYAAQGLGDYNQAVAEAETFGTAGAAEAARKRRKLSELEKAQFSGSAGTASNALNRDRAMTNQMLGTPGAGSF